MGIRSILGMKMAVLLLVFLVTPTLAVSEHVESHEPNQPSLVSPLSSPSPSPVVPFGSDPPEGNGIGYLFKCPKLVTDEMVAAVLERIKLPGFIKGVLRRSVKFGVCIAEKFCGCLMLKFEPLVGACFVKIGLQCTTTTPISGHIYDCTAACANSMMKDNPRFSEDAIGGFCYSNCMKSV